MVVRRHDLIPLALLWLSGISLRVTVLAVPPLLPAIHASLHLDETLVGALTALPVLLLAAAAVPGSLLISRVGARSAILAGLCLLAAAGAARGVGPSVGILFAATFLMGVGVAVSQPALPTLVRQWEPGRVALATAVYTNGLLVGEILAAGLTVPFVEPLTGQSWEAPLAAWSIPVLLTALAIALLTAPSSRGEQSAPALWWPDWRSPLTWRLGLIFGGASAAYFGANAFIPDYLKATHHVALIVPALTTLNGGQIPSSLIVAGMGDRLIARRRPIVLAGVLMAASGVALAMGGVWVVVWATVLGFSSALVFVLVLALPPLLAPERDVHRLSAGIFTITYCCPFLGSLLGGGIWDVTGRPITAFAPVVLGGVLMAVLLRGLDLAGHAAEQAGVVDGAG